MEKKAESHLRLVLVPCPYQGHINPMLQLGTMLHSRGFSITIAHSKYNSPSSSTHPQFMFLTLPDGLSDLDISSGDFTIVLQSVNRNCIVPLKESLGQMMEQKDEYGEIVGIIHDTVMWFAEEVGQDLKIPIIILQTSNAANFWTYRAYPQLEKDGYIPLQDSMLLDLVPGLEPLRFKDLPIHNFEHLSGLMQIITTTSSIKVSSAMIWNTMDCIERSTLEKLQKQYNVPFFPIGPLQKIAPASSGSLLKEDSTCITWLDKQNHNSVIYVSLGSVASIDEKEFTEMAWGLANSKQPFLWVVRPGSIRGLEWIEKLPEGYEEEVGERCCIVKWAPQKEVLAHCAVGGFWCHCGWNSTIESISEGVPMICQPCFGDQRVSARYVSHVWKTGLEFDNDLEREVIENTVRRLMVEVEGQEIRQNAKELKEKVQQSMKKGGSSYNSFNDLVDYILSF